MQQRRQLLIRGELHMQCEYGENRLYAREPEALAQMVADIACTANM